MINLVLGNSESKIEGLSVSQYKELRDLLSYTISAQQSHFSHSHNSKRYLINKRGEFPSGLIDIVNHYLRTVIHTEQYHLVDNRLKPEPKPGMFKIKGIKI